MKSVHGEIDSMYYTVYLILTADESVRKVVTSVNHVYDSHHVIKDTVRDFSILVFDPDPWD